MAAKRKSKAREAQLAFEALSIEGGLLSPEWLSKVAQLQAGTQAEADYRIHKGLNLRDEIGRYWRIAQAHWADFRSGLEAKADPKATAERFVLALLCDSFGFTALTSVEPSVVQDRTYPIGHATLGGRVPTVVAPADGGLDTLSSTFGDGARRRSAFGLAQEYLNAQDGALWGIASDGMALRIVRDNASLTRPAWIEADLRRIFTEDRYADFAALWLLCHETRFGRDGQPVTECALEVWRDAGRQEGTRAREHLRRGVEEALVALGQGFLSHAENVGLRADLQNGAMPAKDFFNQLLRLVYRLIFLLTVEERGLLHPEGASDATKALYASGYGIRRLRERSVKRSAHDRFSDLWDATNVVCRALAAGEPRLGLPAFAGIFAANQCPALDGAKLENRALLLAIFKLAWLREDGSLCRVNWRDMGPEELGSVYESLLELVPQIAKDGRQFAFATGGETKGNARKTTGSYYTPDSLVQVLLGSALEPVIVDTIARHPGKAVEALLGLSVVDPACGSGHFLLAAARRLAAHVARLQANGTPSAAEYRHALRQVVGRCIFGVDLNPMAVELCKVGLWMEAVEPGLPLTFLNSHIQHGNALLGTTPELIAKGIPDAAWDPIEGDEKRTANALKARNRKAAEGQRSLDTLWTTPANTEAQVVTRAIAELDAASDANVDALTKKEECWDGILGSREYRHQKFVADAWCAAFVWPKQPGDLTDAAPTNELWRQLRDGQGKAPALTTKSVNDLADQYRFFHWHLQFPQVFAKGGFDVVLGNPPWERLRLQDQEWFAARVPAIAEATNAARRRALIEKLRLSEPSLYQEFMRDCRRAEAEPGFLRVSGRFPLCGVGRDINTSAVFMELMRALLGEHGRLGCVVPAGTMLGDTTKDFVWSVVEAGTLRSVYHFENEELLFAGVHHAFRFCLVVISGLGDSKGQCSFVFHARSVPESETPGRAFFLGASEIRRLNPITGTLSAFKFARDATLALQVYAKVPILADPVAEKQKCGWAIATRPGHFHMSNDAELFCTAREMEDQSQLEFVALYEPKMMWAFDHRFGTYDGQTEAQAKQGKLPETSDSWHQDPLNVVRPHYWVLRSHFARKVDGQWSRPWVLAVRKIMSSSNERTAIAAILPDAPCGDALTLASSANGAASDHLVLAATINSFIYDFLARQKVTGLNFLPGIFRQLPVPSPAVIRLRSSFDTGNSVAEWLVGRAIELTYTAWDLEPFAREVGYDGPPFRWEPDRRFVLRCELDAALFHLYGLSRDDCDYVMETFPIVRRNDEKAHGEYRTKRVILEMYDAMAEAARTGSTYQTQLSPPPADPRIAHPPRESGKVIPLPVKPAARPQPAVAPDLAALAANAWTRPHTMERGEIQAAILAVLKANGTPMDRRQARLASLLSLEPHLLASMLDKAEQVQWARVVGSDAKKAASAPIDTTSQEWGAALTGLRGRDRMLEDLHRNTWAPGTGIDAIDTRGWPDGRACFVVDMLRRLQASMTADAIILKLPTNVQQWLANAA